MNPTDSLRPPHIYRLVCRPALPKDTPDVMELTRTIWDGQDYVPQVWAEWLADPEGLLAVAEYKGRVVGVGKITRFGEHEWWMEGLRVHPNYEGQGIAAHIFDYLLGIWQRQYGGLIRLATASFRTKIHHLCQRTGFEKLGEFIPFAASALPAGVEETTYMEKVLPREVENAYALARTSQTFPLVFGLFDRGWQWSDLALGLFIDVVDQGNAWWWKGGQGLALFMEDAEEQVRKTMMVQFLGCPVKDLTALLQDCRHLASERKYERVGWVAPPQPDIQNALQKAGFQQSWDGSVYVFEKRQTIVMV